MARLWESWRRLQAEAVGATMAEWALVVGLIAVVAILAVNLVGSAVAARLAEYAGLA